MQGGRGKGRLPRNCGLLWACAPIFGRPVIQSRRVGRYSRDQPESLQKGTQIILDRANRTYMLETNAPRKLLCRHPLVVSGPLLPKCRQACTPRRPTPAASRQVPQQKPLVIGILPDHMPDAILPRIPHGIRVLPAAPPIDQHGLCGEGRPPSLDVRDSLRRALHERKRITSAGLQNLTMDMEMHSSGFAREAIEKRAVAILTGALATEVDGPSRRYTGAAPAHPRRGMAPYTPDRYLRYRLSVRRTFWMS